MIGEETIKNHHRRIGLTFPSASLNIAMAILASRLLTPYVKGTEDLYNATKRHASAKGQLISEPLLPLPPLPLISSLNKE